MLQLNWTNLHLFWIPVIDFKLNGGGSVYIKQFWNKLQAIKTVLLTPLLSDCIQCISSIQAIMNDFLARRTTELSLSPIPIETVWHKLGKRF